MKTPNFVRNYTQWTRQLIKEKGEAQAMSIAVGGNFEGIGVLERCLMVQYGLQKDHRLIDVGCGSGRLAVQLKDYLTGQYIGIDVVPELLRYAQKICSRPDWKFYIAPGLVIPEPDQSADFVSFFSVFTHLLHEESYKYLQEAFRVLKAGGKVVFSFMEFAVPDHWNPFEGSLADSNPDKVLLQFIGRDAIHAWAEHLHVSALEIYGADKPQVVLDRPIRWDSGAETAPGNVIFGQSLCVLTK